MKRTKLLLSLLSLALCITLGNIAVAMQQSELTCSDTDWLQSQQERFAKQENHFLRIKKRLRKKLLRRKRTAFKPATKTPLEALEEQAMSAPLPQECYENLADYAAEMPLPQQCDGTVWSGPLRSTLDLYFNTPDVISMILLNAIHINMFTNFKNHNYPNKQDNLKEFFIGYINEQLEAQGAPVRFIDIYTVNEADGKKHCVKFSIPTNTLEDKENMVNQVYATQVNRALSVACQRYLLSMHDIETTADGILAGDIEFTPVITWVGLDATFKKKAAPVAYASLVSSSARKTKKSKRRFY